MAAAVRQPLPRHTPPRRALDERIALRFPRLAALQARIFSSLTPSAWIRRAVAARSAHHALAAYNRRDLAAVTALTTADFEYRPGREWVEAGLVDASDIDEALREVGVGDD